MLILGIESSCDDTAAAVVDCSDKGAVALSSIVSSQDALHARYGGVVPELASRAHIETIIPVVESALEAAGVAIDDLDAMAVTEAPGLVGSLLVGMSFIKGISLVNSLPFVGVNHILAHAHAAFLLDSNGDDDKNGGSQEEDSNTTEVPDFPFVALVVSGGHTTLMHMTDHGEYTVLGRTLDDAAGEAFDKTAKLLGLGYPGGRVIDSLATEGNREAIRFPRALLSKESLDFSFSGVKTSVLTHIQKLKGGIDDATLRDIAASFQEAVVECLVTKALRAMESVNAATLVIAGGVACNSRLREKAAKECERHSYDLYIPPPKYCSDNGAMIAALGYHKLKKGERAGFGLNAKPGLKDF
ncbi:MAG: tRNA (adenosine(37)-N6)-threonylcarbamoyltransferase complex transferase subunit TsaD [Proteobacteria bacterium]|nr:tRNA (adenosine(37)-N6)-threonylcarbamoyltransferase complex transferase subunit TsaD [Pseudomonadota bacterium]